MHSCATRGSISFPRIPATACHQRNYFETYSRYSFEETYPTFKPLLKAVEAFRTYITNNGQLIPNYGERYRHGEAIATGFVESR